MKVFIWLMKHVPGLAWLAFRVLLPVWNFFWSNLEAIFYLRKRRIAVNVLKTLRYNIGSAATLAQWYAERGFQWRPDPLGGMLDFSSKPWVSIARNRGDCDDMMRIAEYALKGKFTEAHRCHAFSKSSDGHATYLLRAEVVWFVMSNQQLLGPFKTLELAASCFYGADTAWLYVL